MQTDNDIFILRHKDIDVAILQIDNNSEIVNCHILNHEHIPYLGSDGKRCILEWWRERSIPEGRKYLSELLKKHGCENASELLIKNLGLGLTDTYWICPGRLQDRIHWDDVNLFKNGNKIIHFYDGVGKKHYTADKDVALSGSLDKYASFTNNKWILNKFSNPKYPDDQQSINEVFVSKINEIQNKIVFAKYQIISADNIPDKCCCCDFFTNENAELMSAFEITGGNAYEGDFPDDQKELKNFIITCAEKGIKQEDIQSYLDYMFLLDFIVSNTDRHWGNFGILRDPENLNFLSIAPMYDNGNSMFFDSNYTWGRLSLLRNTDNGLCHNEIDRLSIVKNKFALNSKLLPSPSAVKNFYIFYGLSEKRADIIAKSYSNKLDLLIEYQYGISPNIGKEFDRMMPAVINQRFNKQYFEKYPDELTLEIKEILNNLNNEDQPLGGCVTDLLNWDKYSKKPSEGGDDGEQDGTDSLNPLNNETKSTSNDEQTAASSTLEDLGSNQNTNFNKPDSPTSNTGNTIKAQFTSPEEDIADDFGDR